MFGPGFCGGGFGWGLGHGPGMLFMLGLVFIGLTLVLGWGRGGSRETAARPDEALELLRRRYAAGELDEADYLARRNNLRDSAAAGR